MGAKISSLPPADALTGAEQMLSVQNGRDVIITPAQLFAYLNSHGGIRLPSMTGAQLDLSVAGLTGFNFLFGMN